MEQIYDGYEELVIAKGIMLKAIEPRMERGFGEKDRERVERTCQ